MGKYRWNSGVRWRIAVLTILAAALVVTGCTQQPEAMKELEEENKSLREEVADLEEQLSNAEKQNEELKKGEQQNGDPQQPTSKETITLYFIESTQTDFWLVPEVREVQGGDNLMKTAMEELIKGPTDPELDGLIPADTKLLDIKVENFIAYPNFNTEITRLSVGASGEALLAASIANTLIKLPGIEKVQILVEGKTVESLAGHVDISKPLGRNEASLKLSNSED